VVAPADWKEIKVGDYAHITTGKKNTQDRIADGKYPFFVRSQNVERINSYSYDGEAVLTAGDGVGTGKVFHYINGKFDCHQRVYRITDFRSDLNGKFFYLLFSRLFYDRIMSMTAKSSVDSVRMEMISEMELIVPSSIREQELIAEALSDADAAIESLDSLIAKKRDVKQATMQQLLTGRTRLPGFDADWKEVRLGDIALVVMGQSPQSIYYNTREDGIPLIQGNADINDRKSIRRIWTSVSPKVAEPGDVLITVRAPVGYAAIASEQVCLGRGVCAIQPHAADSRFVFHSLVYWEPKWKKLEQGSTFTAANSKEVNDFTIHVPDSTKEQEAIAEALTVMDDELAALTEQVSKLRMVKEGMMQDLLTGKVRLV
jgi:type I restriction enzyme S subunit